MKETKNFYKKLKNQKKIKHFFNSKNNTFNHGHNNVQMKWKKGISKQNL